MGYKDQCALEGIQKLFEPGDSLNIEMVRWFIEQNHAGCGDKRAGQQYSSLHSRGEYGKLVVTIQIHALQNLCYRVLVLPFFLRWTGRQGIGHHLHNRPRYLLGNILREECNGGSGGDDHFAGVGFDDTAQQPQECRLARAIAPQEANPLSRFNLAGNVLQQWRAAKTDRKPTGRDNRHTNSCWVGREAGSGQSCGIRAGDNRYSGAKSHSA